jgi:hypothetical protein
MKDTEILEQVTLNQKSPGHLICKELLNLCASSILR